MNNLTDNAPQTERTNTPSELTDDALDNVSGGAGYIKFDGVDGECTARKGNVEYSWKVEAGE